MLSHRKKGADEMEGNSGVEGVIKFLLEKGDFSLAVKKAFEWVKAQPRNPEAWNDLGVVYVASGNQHKAARCFKKALVVEPGFQPAKLNMERLGVKKLHGGREKITFICSPFQNAGFLDDIIGSLGGEWDVKLVRPRTVGDALREMERCDVAWLEWCDEGVEKISRHGPFPCRVICRLHSYEVFTDVPLRVRWEVIDDLILVSEEVKRLLLRMLPSLEDLIRVHVIHNGVNLGRFPFMKRERGYNLAYVGYINYKKNPQLLLYCMHELVKKDPRYRLFIAGEHQDPRIELYMHHMIRELGLESHVIFCGWVDDVGEWLEDKHYVISTSLFESFGYAIAESMACGLKPVIHRFPGSERLYPERFLFRTPEEFVGLVMEDDYRPEEYRRFVEDNYSLEKQMRRISRLLGGVDGIARKARTTEGGVVCPS